MLSVRILVFGLCLCAAGVHAASDSPLHEAVKSRDKAKVELLLAGGANVNASVGGATPLYWVANNGYTDIAMLLLAKGADANARERQGHPPFHMAISNGQKETAELLLAQGADNNINDRYPRHLGTIESASETQVEDINIKDKYGRTALHWAVHGGEKDRAESLLAHGADINAKEGLTGNTPLHVAVKHRNFDLARWLVAHGADANARNMNRRVRPYQDGRLPMDGGGETPADLASHSKDDPEQRGVMVTFLEKAAVASWQHSEGSSPRQILQSLVAQLKRESSNQTLRKAILDLVQKLQPQPAVPPEAEHFEGRGEYIFKDAKSNTDMLDAAREYLKAMEIAPWIAGYYFDLCLILERANRPFEAQRACEFYLVAAPEAEEASDVRKRIAGFGAQIERKQYRDEGRGIRKDEGLGWLATYNLYR